MIDDSIINKAIHRRDLDTLGGFSISDLLNAIEHIWDREAGTHLPNFDELFNAGYSAKKLDMAQVEHHLKEWIKKRDPRDQSMWDVAGCFLMGYWPSNSKIDEELFCLLLSAVEKADLSEGPRDTMIVALSHAFPHLEDKGLAERTLSGFQDLWIEARGKDYQPLVIKALKFVLKTENVLPEEER